MNQIHFGLLKFKCLRKALVLAQSFLNNTLMKGCLKNDIQIQIMSTRNKIKYQLTRV